VARRAYVVIVAVLSLIASTCGMLEPMGNTVGPAPVEHPTQITTTTIGGRIWEICGDGDRYCLISGSEARVISPRTDPSLRSVTERDGIYRISGIDAVSFTVRYSHPRYQTVEREYNFPLGTEIVNLNVTLVR